MPFKVTPRNYQCWRSMKDRCLNPNHRSFKNYGGRGITICPEWVDSYATFDRDMGPKPDGCSLDRIDNDKGYSPNNCRWADKKTQQRNRRAVRSVTIQGAKYRAVDLAESSGLKTDTIIARAAKGLTFKEVTATGRRVFLGGLALGGKANGKRVQSRTHCVNGHEFTDENTSLSKEGWRRCRACKRAKEARRRDRMRQAR